MRTRSVVATVAVIVVLAGAAAAFALLKATGAAAAGTDSPPISLTIAGLTPVDQPIHAFSYSWGLTNVSSNGKPDLQDLHVTKQLDTLSPDLVQAVKSKQGFASATLIVSLQTAQGLVPKFRYDLTGVTISSDSQGGAEGGGTPSESVSIHANTVDLHSIG